MKGKRRRVLRRASISGSGNKSSLSLSLSFRLRLDVDRSRDVALKGRCNHVVGGEVEKRKTREKRSRESEQGTTRLYCTTFDFFDEKHNISFPLRFFLLAHLLLPSSTSFQQI